MARFTLTLAALAAFAAVIADAGRQESGSEVLANPIRKVVQMLQSMQKKVQEEGKKEEELYEHFMCYCRSGNGGLTASISAAETKVPAVSSDIKSSEEKLVQTKSDLKQAQEDRSAAKSAMAEATALREKEAASHSAERAELESTISAVKQAVAALAKGMAGSFLQSGAAQVLRQLALGKQDMLDADRQELMSFLSSKQGSGYVPRSGEVTGILKEIGDTTSKSLADATAAEEAAVKSYEDLIAAKTKEVQALSQSVEAKTSQIGELGVAIVQMKEDLSDTETALMEDRKFQADLKESCSTKTAEWEERSKTRADELVALAETIKLLNEDDALELFKKTLPGAASASFVQVGVNVSELSARALAAIAEARREAGSEKRPELDLLALALNGRSRAHAQGGFDKVIKMIDNMIGVLKKEQEDDDHKKEYCTQQLDLGDDKKKSLARSVADAEQAIDMAQENIKALGEEIESLEAGIKALDKSVAEATEQRKDENKEFQELMTSNTAAKKLLAFAKNRLNKFYNPKLYSPEPKSDGADAAPALVEVSIHRQRKDTPAPPPETWGAYATKSQETTGVVAMLDLLIKDLDKEMTEAETEEKAAQKAYETATQESAEKRATDSKSMSNKLSAKADTEAALQQHKETKESTGKELMATLKFIQSLHAECDWLMQYHDVRKEARAGEVDSLKRAKAVLSGADYALLQTRARSLLRGSA